MKRKNFMLTVAAAAVLGAFNPAFAGGDAKHGSADINTDASAGMSVERETGDTKASAGTSTERSSRGNAQFGHSDMTLGGNVGPSTSAENTDQANAERVRELERADRIAGAQGQEQERDRQGLN
jgi:hypothetical protein